MNCKKDRSRECLGRDTECEICCVDDREAEHELILPLVDKITDALNVLSCDTVKRTDCQDILSKMIYLLTLVTPLSSCDKEIIQMAKEGIYIGHSLYEEEDKRPMIRGFVVDIITWFKDRLNGMCRDIDAFKQSLSADLMTIKTVSGFCVETQIPEYELDDLFF